MVNTYRKGSGKRLRAIKLLRRQGFNVEIVEKTGRYIQKKDLYGCWDLIAIQPNITKLIQVKSNYKGNIKLISEFARKYHQFICEIWVFKDWKRDINLFRFDNEGKYALIKIKSRGGDKQS